MILRGLNVLAVVVVATGLQACGNLNAKVVEEKDDRSANRAAEKASSKDQSAADSEAALGQLGLTLPATGDFDKARIDVCAIGFLKQKGHWKHDREGEDWQDKPEWIFEESYDDEGNAVPPKTVEPRADDEDANVALHDKHESPPYVGSEELPPEAPVPTDMPPMPGQHLDQCRKHVSVDVAFKGGKPVLVEGVPFGAVIVHVALLKADKVIEAGFGKALVTPGVPAKATIAVFPVAGELEVEIKRLGEDGAGEWWPLKPKKNGEG